MGFQENSFLILPTVKKKSEKTFFIRFSKKIYELQYRFIISIHFAYTTWPSTIFSKILYKNHVEGTKLRISGFSK